MVSLPLAFVVRFAAAQASTVGSGVTTAACVGARVGALVGAVVAALPPHAAISSGMTASVTMRKRAMGCPPPERRSVASGPADSDSVATLQGQLCGRVAVRDGDGDVAGRIDVDEQLAWRRIPEGARPACFG